jgi:hypothetical protein
LNWGIRLRPEDACTQIFVGDPMPPGATMLFEGKEPDLLIYNIGPDPHPLANMEFVE